MTKADSLKMQVVPHYYNNFQLLQKNSVKGKKKEIKVAAQVHIFYVDLIDEIIKYLNNVPMPFDLYISTDTESKKEIIKHKFQNMTISNNVQIDVFENRGRDVAPFIVQMRDYIDDYDYVCHIHTKKSKHLRFFSSGDKWRMYLFDNLLGSEDFIRSILDIFEKNPDVGVVCPQPFRPIIPWMEWNENLDTTTQLIKTICKKDVELPNKPEFPVGNMLWFRNKAVRNLFCSEIQLSVFENETGQLDGTLAHAIERSWFYIADSNGYSSLYYNYYKQSIKLYFPFIVAKIEKSILSLLK